MSAPGPHWTQDQAIAYEAALEAINDVIAGYSEQIDIARNATPPDMRRIGFLHFRTEQALDLKDFLNVEDGQVVQEILGEYGAIVRVRDEAERHKNSPCL